MIGGRTIAGGSALYAGLTARALGCEVEILTSHGDDWVGSFDLPMRVVPAAATTTFEHVYQGGHRRSRVTARAATIDGRVTADVVFLCPVVGEVSCEARGLVGVGLQGWLREIAADGKVRARRLGALPPGDVWFASTHDLSLPPEGPGVFAWTDGERGADIRVDGVWHHVPAVSTETVDPTGAGDVFAAAFLVAMARGREPLAAARAGAAAAAVVVQDVGVRALLGRPSFAS